MLPVLRPENADRDVGPQERGQQALLLLLLLLLLAPAAGFGSSS